MDKNEWILFEEKQPEPYESVLFIVYGENIVSGFVTDGGQTFSDVDANPLDSKDVIYWRPQPEIPSDAYDRWYNNSYE